MGGGGEHVEIVRHVAYINTRLTCFLCFSCERIGACSNGSMVTAVGFRVLCFFFVFCLLVVSVTLFRSDRCCLSVRGLRAFYFVLLCFLFLEARGTGELSSCALNDPKEATGRGLQTRFLNFADYRAFLLLGNIRTETSQNKETYISWVCARCGQNTSRGRACHTYAQLGNGKDRVGT